MYLITILLVVTGLILAPSHYGVVAVGDFYRFTILTAPHTLIKVIVGKLKNFTGISNDVGYYSDGFWIPYNATKGRYNVTIHAEKDGMKADEKLFLHIVSRIPNDSPSTVNPLTDNEDDNKDKDHKDKKKKK